MQNKTGSSFKREQQSRAEVIDITTHRVRLSVGGRVLSRFQRGATIRSLGREFGIGEREAEAHVRDALLMKRAA